MNLVDHPFDAPPVLEVPLPNAPLVKVVAQVRFPAIASVAREDFIGPFQEELRDRYPVLRKEREVNIVLTSEGMEPAKEGGTVWRFHDKTSTWELALGLGFMALVTSEYSSRKDFLARFSRALESLERHIRPATLDRLGMRYVDRISSPQLNDITKLIRKEVLGMLLIPDLGTAEIRQSLCSSRFMMPDGAELTSRWGLIPGGVTADPFVEPSDEPTWLLDLDMFQTSFVEDFSAKMVSDRSAIFAERIYRFFRWAITPDFLQVYGGHV